MVQELAEVQQEGASVVELLQQRQAGLSSTLGQHFPEMRNTIWQSESSVQAAAQSLTPQMTENKKKVGAIRLDVAWWRLQPRHVSCVCCVLCCVCAEMAIESPDLNCHCGPDTNLYTASQYGSKTGLCIGRPVRQQPLHLSRVG